jgi:hypothetical protein
MHACNRRVLASSRRASEQACGNLARIARKIVVQGWRPSSARLQHQPNKELGFGSAVPGIMPKNSAVLVVVQRDYQQQQQQQQHYLLSDCRALESKSKIEDASFDPTAQQQAHFHNNCMCFCIPPMI